MNRLKSYCMSTDAPKLWEWFLFGLLLLIPFVSYFYGDTGSILNYEVNYMGSIVEAGWRSFYEYSKYKVENGGANGYGNYATYDYPMYVVLGIWGIPLWIFLGSRGLGVNDYFIARIYGKSILLVALAVSAWLIYSICRELKISQRNAKWGAFLFCSSILTFIAIGINGQTDILGIVFILLGLRAFIRKKRIRFILFFMVAFTFKQYALFLFVPLLLLVEKKVWKIGISTAAVMVLHTLSDMAFGLNSPAIIEKKNFELDIFNRLLANRFPLVNATVPVVGVLLLAVCVYCYLHKEIDNEEEFYRLSVFVPALSMVALFISFESSSYWYLHLAPYLAILMVYNTGELKRSMMFETAALLCLTLGNYGSRPWAYEIYGCSDMILEKIFGNYDLVQTPFMLTDFCQKVPITKYAGALYAVFVVFLCALIWLNRPSKMRNDENAPIRAYSAVRLFLNAAVVYIPLVLFVYNVLFL